MTLKHLIAGGILCAATMVALPAAAMPVDNLARATHQNIEQVHWVCGRYRCWWSPNYYYRSAILRRSARLLGRSAISISQLAPLVIGRI